MRMQPLWTGRTRLLPSLQKPLEGCEPLYTWPRNFARDCRESPCVSSLHFSDPGTGRLLGPCEAHSLFLSQLEDF